MRKAITYTIIIIAAIFMWFGADYVDNISGHSISEVKSFLYNAELIFGFIFIAVHFVLKYFNK